MSNGGLGHSSFQSLIGDIVVRSVFEGLQDSGTSGFGVGVLGKAVAAGSEFMTGLWGQQKTVKKVRKPKSKSGVMKKVARKRKGERETVAGDLRKVAAKDKKQKTTVGDISKKDAAKDKKTRETVADVSKKVWAKDKKETARGGIGKTKADAKSAKPRKKAST